MNLSSKLKQTLNEEYKEILEIIAQYADLCSVNAYVIGGVVRDLLLDKPVYDVDIVIEGDAIKFCKFIEEQGLCIIHKFVEDFGTVKVSFNSFPNIIIDFASTRKEIYPKAGHLPAVEKIGCPLEEDILRRDFSVNALAIQINKSSFGKLIDYVNGLDDLRKKELKILHKKSFEDDPTRIIRGLRFKYKLDFVFEKETLKLLNNYLVGFQNNDICYERIKQVIKLALNLNVKELFEEFLGGSFYKLLTLRHRYVCVETLYAAIVKYENIISPESIWLIYLACILNVETAKKMNLTAKELDIFHSVENLLSNSQDLNTNIKIYNLFKNEPIEAIIAYSVFDNNEIVQKYLFELKNIKPILNGNDLIELGFSRGKIIGEVLNKILEKKLDNQLKTKEEELLFARELL